MYKEVRGSNVRRQGVWFAIPTKFLTSELMRDVEVERGAGRGARITMQKEPFVIVEYSDKQALEDGVLVSVPGEGKVNRVTRAVFDYFTKPIGSSPVAGEVTDITPLQDAIRALLKIEPDEGAWRTGTYEGKKLWLIPNEVGGLTLLFPDDY
jgi:hypothetical protein